MNLGSVSPPTLFFSFNIGLTIQSFAFPCKLYNVCSYLQNLPEVGIFLPQGSLGYGKISFECRHCSKEQATLYLFHTGYFSSPSDRRMRIFSLIFIVKTWLSFLDKIHKNVMIPLRLRSHGAFNSQYYPLF